MSKSVPYINEIVSFAVMVLMAIAVVASQADAKIHEAVRADAAPAEARGTEEIDAPFSVMIDAHIDGNPLMISIDAVAEFNHFRFEHLQNGDVVSAPVSQ
ncbi:MAG: hypothetical protein OEQ90_01570 [Gammaproteobacteria bacterium]|nr:hypothetical protein [Gammaproteobacteria bacterium]